jgi:methylase of polypeptide subunit release factors
MSGFPVDSRSGLSGDFDFVVGNPPHVLRVYVTAGRSFDPKVNLLTGGLGIFSISIPLSGILRT